MQTDPELASLLEQIRQEWNHAEKTIKLAEIVSDEVVVPAIYELRYAGRRIIDAYEALAQNRKNDAEKFLTDACLNCFRARHDAIDAATAKIAIDVERIGRKVGVANVQKYYPDFGRLAQEIWETRLKIAASRQDRNNRDQIYRTIESTDLPRLASEYKKLRFHNQTLKHLLVRERLIKTGTIGTASLIVIGHVADFFGFWQGLASLFG